MQQHRVLQNKRVGVIGLGLTGMSCVNYLQAHDAQVFAFDSRAGVSRTLPTDIPLHTGELPPKILASMDILVVSPGISIKHTAIQYAMADGVQVIGDIELFAWANEKPVIAITGSNGKSTVTSLVHHMLNHAGVKAVMGGNIGVPVLSLFDSDYDVAVLELSSFQLETTHSLQPLAATVLNVTPDHLDRYQSFNDYHEAKMRIYQGASTCVSNHDDALTASSREIQDTRFGSQGEFSLGDDNNTLLYLGKPWLMMSDCKLSGKHNAFNIQAAAALCVAFGLPITSLVTGARSFDALAHRCQQVSSKQGITWIDDSKATNVGAAVTAIKSVAWQQNSGRLILIAGGDAKGADLGDLSPVVAAHVDALVVLGKDAKQFLSMADKVIEVDSIEAAVVTAAQCAQRGDTVLLSPACASIDMFDNYQHRGQLFAAAVEALA